MGGERETETERERQREREPKYADRNEELFALTKTASTYDHAVYVLL